MRVKVIAGPNVGRTGRAMEVSQGVYFVIFDEQPRAADVNQGARTGLYLIEEIATIGHRADARRKGGAASTVGDPVAATGV